MYQAFVGTRPIGTQAAKAKDCWEFLRNMYVKATDGMDEFEVGQKDCDYISDAINDLEELALDSSDETAGTVVGILVYGTYIADDPEYNTVTVKKV